MRAATDDPLEHDYPNTHLAERQRFLAARGGNVAQAVELLRNHLVWRSTNLHSLAATPLLIGSTLCVATRLNLTS